MTSGQFEWYLRRCCEDELIERKDRSVRTRAQALSAIGALDEQSADAVLAGYATAHRLRRGDEHDHDHDGGVASALLGELTFRRAATTIDQPWGSVRIRSLVTSDDETSIAVEVNSSDQHADNPFRDIFRGRNTVEIRDARRKRHDAHFNGGGSDGDLSGHLVVHPALRRDTAWITVLDHRVDLAPPPDDVTVEIVEAPATLSTSERAARYLTRCLALTDRAGFYGGADPVQVVVDTYIDCDVLSADSPAVAESLALAALFVGGRSSSVVPRSGAGARRRRRRAHRGNGAHDGGDGGDGAVGTRLIGLTTPTFDGIRIAVVALTADHDHFGIEFRAGGPGTAKAPQHGLPFTVTARDDVGNHYVGQAQNWGSRSDGLTAEVGFDTPLDSRATVLDLHLGMITSEAVVRIPLSWDDAS